MKTLFIEQTGQQPLDWNQINWQQTERIVRRLQERIYRATQRQEWQTVRSLQKLLACATANKLLAIRRVTQENQGKRTAGVDGKVYLSAQARSALAQEPFSLKGYRPRAVRRVYIPKSNGKQRPLGIPTIRDRVYQAIIKAALEPEWEARFEQNSYGFRPGRCTMDAMEQMHAIFACAYPSCWVLDADISGCFDHLAHEPLLARIPVFKTVVRRWLKAGVVELGHYQETKKGTPQGGVVSPLLANIALDGLERLFDCEHNGQYVSPYLRSGRNRGVSVVRYADDFVATAPNREVLEDYVRPKIEQFLAERGLVLSEAKTRIVHIDQGFNFLGFTIRRFKDKVLTKPQKEKVQAHVQALRDMVRSHRNAPVTVLVQHLTALIRGWANYYRHSAAKRTFSQIDYHLWRMLWAWGKRRHPHKGARWLRRRYWYAPGSRQRWRFGEGLTRLIRPSSIRVERWVKVAGKNSPYDPTLHEYWHKRRARQLEAEISGEGKLNVIRRQNYRCQHCGGTLQAEDAIDLHHQIPRAEGGPDTMENLVAMHEHCHQQWHARHGEVVRKA